MSRKTALKARTPIRQIKAHHKGVPFALLYLTVMSNKGMYKSVSKGIPALVCIRTNEKVTIDGRVYTVLKLMYDLKGEFLPLATMKP